MIADVIQSEIQELIEQRKLAELKGVLAEWHPADLAEAIVGFPIEQQGVIFRILPQPVAADVFEYLDRATQKQLLKALGQEDTVRILNEMTPDDRTALLEELPSVAVTQLLGLLSPAERATAQHLLGYPEGSIGRLMTPDFIAVRDEWTVQQVLDHVRQVGRDSETLNVLYVVDEGGTLIDDVRIREFLLRPLAQPVREIRNSEFFALKVTDSGETAVEAFRKYDRTTLPVVDSAGKLVGIVTVDDVLDIAEAAATEDIQKMGGSEALDEPYRQIALRKMIRKRAGWLVVLFLGELLTATAMGYFEEEIAKAVVLALFVPLIISSGGNSGSQAATLIIRAMALGEVTLRDWWQVMRREVLAGLALGGILGVIGFVRITAWSLFSNIYGPHWFLVAITVGLSLVGVVLWGTLAGSMLPFLLRRMGFDPAASSAPFVATLVDVTGLVIYFGVAALILSGTLL
ncbi:MAG: Magnesium transporter MgtE [Verrucomicrobiae bacterium]|nr:Magnesium transporter MgtE [Verrucomicrobiae bacterium]